MREGEEEGIKKVERQKNERRRKYNGNIKASYHELQ